MRATIKELFESNVRYNNEGQPVDPGSLARLINNDLPIKTAFRLKTIVRRINEIFKDYEEMRVELCKKLGTLDEATGQYEFGENLATFKTELSELQDDAVEIVPEGRFTIASFNSSMAISPVDLERLEWLIDDGYHREEPRSTAKPESNVVQFDEKDPLDLDLEEPEAKAATA
jgi:hypothetical protein